MKPAIYLCISLLLVALVISNIRANRQLSDDRRVISKLNAKQAALDETPSLELQSRCAAAAKDFFNRFGYTPDYGADFMNHYNPKLRKCFIVVKTSKLQKPTGTVLTSKDVFDAVEGKSYGEYVWESDKVKKWWEVDPILCTATKPDGSAVTCKSDAEYTALMADYMDIDD